MKLKWKAAIFAGAIVIMTWVLIVDSNRVFQGERIKFLEDRAETLYNMTVDNNNKATEQAEQIEIIRNQLAQLAPLCNDSPY